ncbi:hypothetical protein KVR01_009975 [Diaporthe batatas]|uniref:uncharacterized protein n=1 Tax=Diaporthe batatas TaxID=748121 RepID=UPI001D04FDAD|nr:uncharacterized protein KVR01_009975 [Diaporthe batatas]KAG8160439.1 hypothetical protein KVR01_009975 [Diaporthe batatas]
MASQRALWNIICWNYAADICKTLENTEHVHNDVLHYLYSILEAARAREPSQLIARLASLPDTTAREMVGALEALNIGHAGSDPDGGPGKGKMRQKDELEGKPYFHSAERECFWLIVLELFKAGYLGANTDGSSREAISNFDALHYLYRLDVEDRRCRRNEEMELRNPSHRWYHETSDKQVVWCVRRMWPLVEDKLEGREREA